MKRKIVPPAPSYIIDDCGDCKYFDDSSFDAGGDRYCTRKMKQISLVGIPDWCPLEDAKEVEGG